MQIKETLGFIVMAGIGASITFTGIYFSEPLLIIMGAVIVGIAVMATKRREQCKSA